MDHGWIRTYSSGEEMTTKISVASEGGSGTPVPDLSIEVDSLETALERVKKESIKIEYGPVIEPWGVRGSTSVTLLANSSISYSMSSHWVCSNSSRHSDVLVSASLRQGRRCSLRYISVASKAAPGRNRNTRA